MAESQRKSDPAMVKPSTEDKSDDTVTAAHGGTTSDSVQHGVDEISNREDMPVVPVYSVFSPKTKVFLVLMTVFSTLFSPFSSFMYLPAITPIAESYNRSIADINLTVTLYQVMQAVAPLFFGDLSDQIGRRPVYMISFAIYLGANIGLALQNNYAALMVLRAMQSTGSSATVAIGSAVMADFATSADRGGYITAVQASIMFAPALAPVIGGILTQFLGWRSTFWFLVICAGVFLLIYIPFVPEVSLRFREC
jgi:multidrug resistance protein